MKQFFIQFYFATIKAFILKFDSQTSVILRMKIMTCVFQRYMCTQLKLKRKKPCILNLSYNFFTNISSLK